ncbi:RHS repeat-associated core domain-containing protein [Paenibacillus alvei]|uniref:RHS repeat-associated core domain-containing protein n=1 Tax=Paenibacillus alvei TaxID=44250 RepID=UPI001C106EEF|nr:RHS repeat-associated core domain-containing protein [Paenibacillus alvei]
MDYNARWYNPNIGRFTTEDTYEGDIVNPLSQKNLYTYVTNNPIGYTDPSGHEGIVVSGGNYAVDSHGGYKYNFIEPALKKIWELRKGNPNETIAWLVADEGWNDGDWANYSKAVSSVNVNMVRLSSSDDFINYINKKLVVTAGLMIK